MTCPETLIKPIWKDLCPETVYWFYGMDNFRSSALMVDAISGYMDVELEDFVQMCKDGTLDLQKAHEAFEGAITGDGVILCYDFVISKENQLQVFLSNTKEKFYEYSSTPDMDGNPSMSLTGVQLDKQIESLLTRYIYFQLGQYYFYCLAFDDPAGDYDNC